ncbi:MAG: ABC transporter permease [Acidimicrobiales bacterium]
MSGWESIWLVAERELREAFRRRTFWIIVGVVLVASTAGVVLPELIGSGRTSYDVAVVGRTPELDARLVAVAESLDSDVHLTTAANLEVAARLVADEEVDVAVVAGDRPAVIAKQGRADGFVATAQQVVGVQALADALEAAGLDAAFVERAFDASAPRVVRLDEDGASRQASAAIVSTVLYLLLLMLMIAVANGTAIEKANRISEVLLAIVRPGALLFGKVIGVGLVGILTLSVAVAPPLVRQAVGGDLPAGLGAAILGGGPWFLLGLVLYLTIAGALGALVERQEEAGTVVTPLTILLVGSLLIAQSASDSPLGTVLALFPFTSPMIMPSRIAVGASSGAEMALSLALGLATVLVAVRVGARIYAGAIVRTGRRIKLREALSAS